MNVQCRCRLPVNAGITLLVMIVLCLCGVSSTVSSPAPTLVWDSPEPFLALVLGIMDSDWVGRLTQYGIQEAIAGSGKESKLPIEGITAMSRRLRSPGSEAQWVITFDRPQNIPVPYSILGYKPGRIRISQSFVMDEWKLGDFVFSWEHRGHKTRVALRDVSLWAVGPGTVFMNVDGWLDALLGSTLDDTHIVGFALFRYQHQRYALALGYNTKGEGASGVFNLNRDRLLFPYPEQYKKAARLLRRRLEHLAPSAVAPFRRVGHTP